MRLLSLATAGLAISGYTQVHTRTGDQQTNNIAHANTANNVLPNNEPCFYSKQTAYTKAFHIMSVSEQQRTSGLHPFWEGHPLHELSAEAKRPVIKHVMQDLDRFEENIPCKEFKKSLSNTLHTFRRNPDYLYIRDGLHCFHNPRRDQMTVTAAEARRHAVVGIYGNKVNEKDDQEIAKQTMEKLKHLDDVIPCNDLLDAWSNAHEDIIQRPEYQKQREEKKNDHGYSWKQTLMTTAAIGIPIAYWQAKKFAQQREHKARVAQEIMIDNDPQAHIRQHNFLWARVAREMMIKNALDAHVGQHLQNHPEHNLLRVNKGYVENLMEIEDPARFQEELNSLPQHIKFYRGALRREKDVLKTLMEVIDPRLYENDEIHEETHTDLEQEWNNLFNGLRNDILVETPLSDEINQRINNLVDTMLPWNMERDPLIQESKELPENAPTDTEEDWNNAINGLRNDILVDTALSDETKQQLNNVLDTLSERNRNFYVRVEQEGILVSLYKILNQRLQVVKIQMENFS